MPRASLVAQTTYAELLERCATAAFSDAFPADGSFTSKTLNGRRYRYFQSTTATGRTRRYVGPETPQLLEKIAHHKQARDDQRGRRALLSTSERSYGFPAPIPQIGNLVSALRWRAAPKPFFTIRLSLRRRSTRRSGSYTPLNITLTLYWWTARLSGAEAEHWRERVNNRMKEAHT